MRLMTLNLYSSSLVRALSIFVKELVSKLLVDEISAMISSAMFLSASFCFSLAAPSILFFYSSIFLLDFVVSAPAFSFEISFMVVTFGIYDFCADLSSSLGGSVLSHIDLLGSYKVGSLGKLAITTPAIVMPMSTGTMAYSAIFSN